MMCAAHGARDANAFHGAIRAAAGGTHTYLPPPSSLTYQGLFNQHTYHTGEPERSAVVAVAARSARVPAGFGAEAVDGDVWVGCFLKSCLDGCPRDATPIDVVAVLDVSGSMRGGVAGRRAAGAQRSRLQLAKEALLGLFAQLREDDRFGLATFNSTGTVIQPLQSARDLDSNALQTSINGLMAGGGTTLQAGMEAAVGICRGAGTTTQQRHRRLLFLTDMHDLGSDGMNTMIESQAKDGIYVSFICIGMEFNSQLAEEVSKHRGANYFCITRDEELRKVVVDGFDYNFFPAAFEVEVAQQSDAFDLVAVYGTPYDPKEEVSEADWHPSTHRFYPTEFKQQAKELMLCSGRYTGSLPSPALQQLFGFLSPSARTVIRVDTVFPSAIAADGSTEGGLILLRLRPRSASGSGAGTVRLMTRYVTAAGGAEHSTTSDLAIPSPSALPSPGGEPDPAVAKGVMLQRYVEVCKLYLTVAKQQPQEHIAELRAALERVDALLAELDAAPAKADSLCPGVREELQGFAKMARKHFDETDTASAREVDCKTP